MSDEELEAMEAQADATKYDPADVADVQDPTEVPNHE